MKKGSSWVGVIVVSAWGAACGGAPPPAAPAATPPATASAAPPPVAPASRGVTGSEETGSNDAITRRFAEHIERYRDATYADLVREAAVAPAPTVALDFDPRTARYFELVSDRLAMTPAERERLVAQGVVSVNHDRPASMASTYYDLYTHDLPVLITSDSVLDALHRSYDAMSMELEYALLAPTLDAVLTSAHDTLVARAADAPEALRTSLTDVDLYLTVARSLLAGAGGAKDGSDRLAYEARMPLPATEPVASKLGSDAAVGQVLAAIAGLSSREIAVYGGRRTIDFSQFRPRGHYTDSVLRKYFRGMLWLGRADTGFFLSAPSADSGLTVDVPRERRNAALLAELFAASGSLPRLAAMSDLVSFLVGKADGLGPRELHAALAASGVATVGDLGDDARLATVYAGLGSGAQHILSQELVSPGAQGTTTTPPGLFQTFGQRFVLDSFFLSKMVYDTISYHGEKQHRTLPSPLDVMAALGSDVATRLLEPELSRYHYAPNLLAARKTAAELPEAAWQESLYTRWLDALRTLDDTPPLTAHFPRVMRGPVWQEKQLRTALGSWAELRHDTLLYAKESAGSSAACEYPDAFVEPYPALYDKLAALGAEAGTRLTALEASFPDPQPASRAHRIVTEQARFHARFSSILRYLAKLSRKELAAEPFAPEETQYLKSTIDLYHLSGGAHYDGWYASLVYGEHKEKYAPTIADVHTDPGGDHAPQVLEVGTGPVSLLVVAVDNQQDRAIYVGPALSYYELTVPPTGRLTDEAWDRRLQTEQLRQPAWTARLDVGNVRRDFGERTAPSIAAQPTYREAGELWKQRRTIEERLGGKVSAAERQRLERERAGLVERMVRLGGCGCPPNDPTCPCM